jgi:CrcB protein
MTTFSTWQLDIFNAWINAGQSNRGGLQDVSRNLHIICQAHLFVFQFLNGVGISAITLSLSLASLTFGSSIANVLAPHIPQPQVLRPAFRYGLSCIAVLIYGATFITYFLLPASFRHQATAALMFSFPGALTRYLLSITLNKRTKALPLGTLMANTLGTALLAAFHVLQNINHPVSPGACSLLQGLADGYCGSLTTVSTFAAEINDFGGLKAVRYVMVSWLLGQAMMLLIFGSSIWTGQAREQITCNFQ